MKNTADVAGGKPIALSSQTSLGVSAINSLVAFHDIHRREREVLFFCFVPDTTQDKIKNAKSKFFLLQSLAPTNPHWARVVGYGPFSL
jgi:hypothetical protein